MSRELIGALMDEGYSPQEARELVGPVMDALDDDDDLGSHVADPGGRAEILHDLVKQARDDRQPPGPQVVVPSGVVNSLPHAKAAKAVRVDTEDSYRAFRASGQSSDPVDALSTAAQAELMGDFERGYASQVIGDIMSMEPASRTALHDNPNVSADQACLMCGVRGGEVVCVSCDERLPEIMGLFERGYASQVIGLFERGAAASLHDDNPSATIGDDFYRLDRHEGYAGGRSAVVGQDGFYRLPRHELGAGGLAALIGDVMALSVPSTTHAEEIPLSFHRPEMHDHIATWKQGDAIYGSIRVTGWDGKPRILTGTTSHAKELGIVVGYSQSASVPPSHTIAVIDPLARQLGASRILPQLAAAAPSVLRVSSDKLAPLILTAMPAHKKVRGAWV